MCLSNLDFDVLFCKCFYLNQNMWPSNLEFGVFLYKYSFTIKMKMVFYYIYEC